MASLQNYGFPFYSPPPPTHSLVLPPPYHPNLQPPSHPTLPPPYHPNLQPPPPPSHPILPPISPPPGHPLLPPPTPPSRVPPSPPHHLLPPPPPPHHLLPPPPPSFAPPPPSPGHHTIIIVVFVSLGGLFLLGCLSVALCCFLKKRKKEIKDETDIVRVDEHLKIQEVVLPGPHGTQTVILNIEEDIHVEEEMKNYNEIVDHKGSHHQPKALEIAKATASNTIQHYDQYQKS